MNKEDKRIDKLNILISIFVDLSVDANPSVSISSIIWSFVIYTGLFQIQIPFVHAWVVLPISKPLLWFSNLFAKKDFPLLYGPAIATTDIFAVRGIYSKNIIACWVTSNWPDFESIYMKGIASP